MLGGPETHMHGLELAHSAFNAKRRPDLRVVLSRTPRAVGTLRRVREEPWYAEETPLRVCMRPPWNLRVLSGATRLTLVKAWGVKVASTTVLVASPVID